jgi:hypothetical protein
VALGPASGGGGQAGDVRAGGAFVEISARDRLTSQLLGLRSKALAFAAGLNTIGKTIGFIGGAALAPLTALFKTGLNRAENIEREAEALGFQVVQFQRIKYAADVAGVSIDTVLSKPEKYAGLMAGASILDPGTIREAVQAQQAMRAALIDLQTAAVPLVSTFVPLVRAVAAFVKTNADWIRVAAVGAAGMTAIGAATFVFGRALGLVATVGRGAVAVVGLLLTKTGLIVGVFGGLAAAVLTLTASGRKLAGDLGGAFASVGDTFSVMLKGITDAIKAGDFDKAFKVFTAGIESVWYEMLLNMARAFSTFIENNRDRLIALGGLIGGLKGAGIGGRFGPWGALIGGAAGAAGGGVAIDQLAKLIEGIATNTGLEAMRANAQDRLKMIVGQGNPNRLEVDEDSLPKRITATRGAFRKLLDGNQQFGASDKLETKQLEALVGIRKDLDKLTKAMIDAANANRFK